MRFICIDYGQGSSYYDDPQHGRPRGRRAEREPYSAAADREYWLREQAMDVEPRPVPPPGRIPRGPDSNPDGSGWTGYRDESGGTYEHDKYPARGKSLLPTPGTAGKSLLPTPGTGTDGADRYSAPGRSLLPTPGTDPERYPASSGRSLLPTPPRTDTDRYPAPGRSLLPTPPSTDTEQRYPTPDSRSLLATPGTDTDRYPVSGMSLLPTPRGTEQQQQLPAVRDADAQRSSRLLPLPTTEAKPQAAVIGEKLLPPSILNLIKGKSEKQGRSDDAAVASAATSEAAPSTADRLATLEKAIVADRRQPLAMHGQAEVDSARRLAALEQQLGVGGVEKQLPPGGVNMRFSSGNTGGAELTSDNARRLAELEARIQSSSSAARGRPEASPSAAVTRPEASVDSASLLAALEANRLLPKLTPSAASTESFTDSGAHASAPSSALHSDRSFQERYNERVRGLRAEESPVLLDRSRGGGSGRSDDAYHDSRETTSAERSRHAYKPPSSQASLWETPDDDDVDHGKAPPPAISQQYPSRSVSPPPDQRQPLKWYQRDSNASEPYNEQRSDAYPRYDAGERNYNNSEATRDVDPYSAAAAIPDRAPFSQRATESHDRYDVTAEARQQQHQQRRPYLESDRSSLWEYDDDVTPAATHQQQVREHSSSVDRDAAPPPPADAASALTSLQGLTSSEALLQAEGLLTNLAQVDVNDLSSVDAEELNKVLETISGINSDLARNIPSDVLQAASSLVASGVGANQQQQQTAAAPLHDDYHGWSHSSYDRL